MQVTLTLFLAWLFWIGFLFCSPHQVPEETDFRQATAYPSYPKRCLTLKSQLLKLHAKHL